MGKRELVLVCGSSGAGKTITMNYFETAGFYCIDNLPIISVIPVLENLKDNKTFYKYAISINTKTKHGDILEMVNSLISLDWINFTMLYLDADDDVLVNRYQFTRKLHPFIHDNETLINAIQHEKHLLKNIKQYSDITIDTSDLSPDLLINKLEKIFDTDISSAFKLIIVSFGYKHGVPLDLDYMFDVRFITNPYYLETLRNKTGNDEEVYSYVMEQEETEEFLFNLIPLLDYCIEKQSLNNRTNIVIGVGCTGGQHRSVSIANYLARYYEGTYNVILDHRDAKV